MNPEPECVLLNTLYDARRYDVPKEIVVGMVMLFDRVTRLDAEALFEALILTGPNYA